LNIKISTILPSCENSAQIQKLWVDFIDIIDDLKLDFLSNKEITYLKSKIRDWSGNFLELYQTKDVTPYMQALLMPMFLNSLIYTLTYPTTLSKV